MISKYNFSQKQQEALNTLLEQDEVLISATQSLAVSDATAQDILKNLPDSLSAERKKVIKAACSLVGKVNYFWGGKSSSIGWDGEWGKLKTVSAEGSKTTGTKRPFGLDCSGFVTWSFQFRLFGKCHRTRYARANRKMHTHIVEQCTSGRFSFLRRFIPRGNNRRKGHKRKYPCYPLFK